MDQRVIRAKEKGPCLFAQVGAGPDGGPPPADRWRLVMMNLSVRPTWRWAKRSTIITMYEIVRRSVFVQACSVRMSGLALGSQNAEILTPEILPSDTFPYSPLASRDAEVSQSADLPGFEQPGPAGKSECPLYAQQRGPTGPRGTRIYEDFRLQNSR